MTLLEECKALVREWCGYSYLDAEAILNSLKTIVSRHEHDDWKGWWRCEGCCRLLTQGESVTHECPTKILVPYERRHSERMKS